MEELDLLLALVDGEPGMLSLGHGVPQHFWGFFLLCVSLTTGGSVGQGVQQPSELTVVEGAFVQVNCSFQTSGFNGLFWYQQQDGGAPTFLSYNVLDGLERRGHFSTFLSHSAAYSSLLLQELQMKDSASYFCAVTDTLTVRLLQLHQNSKSHCGSEKLFISRVFLL
ncbi:T cell receptor alpha variable 1-1 [Galemys pyrenaicus]|nr:T cell receptor alpha variable 1-1 [Galemys pyrenaicus]